MNKIRIVLQPLRKQDNESILSLLNKKITKWIQPIPYPPTKKDILRWITKVSKKKNKTFLIVKRSTSVPIGMIWIENITKQRGELGFWLAKDHQGKGYMKEAGIVMTQYARKKLHLRKITALTVGHNRASQKTLENLGFILKKTIKKDFKDQHGKWCDVFVYEKLLDSS